MKGKKILLLRSTSKKLHNTGRYLIKKRLHVALGVNTSVDKKVANKTKS